MGNVILFAAEPEIVKQVLVKDFQIFPNRRAFEFGDPLLDNMMSATPVERWRNIRPVASPAFSTAKMRMMNSLIEDCAKVTAEHLKEAASKKEDIDVVQFFGNYTLDVIARCAFGTRLDSHSDQTNEFVTKSRQAFSGRITLRLLACFMLPAIAKLLKLRAFHPETFLYFQRICQSIIKSRQDKQVRHEDFLQLMMDAQEGKLTATAENKAEQDNRLFNIGVDLKRDTSFSSNKRLTEDEAMAQCLVFFVGGQHTTSSLIAHILYLLSIHPEVQEKLRMEVDECFETHGDHISLDVVSKLKYLHCVVSEALRMYPPIGRLERSPVEDCILGDTGIKLKKGDLVAIPVYAMHHDPQYFPDPFTFKPERFDDDNVGSIQPYTYLPFGAGPRNCIGMRGFEAGNAILFVGEPELVKQVLVKDFPSVPNRRLMMDAQEGKLSATAENTSERDNQLFNLGEDLKPDASFSSNKTLTEDEAMAQCVLFFVAGQDTTASAISYTFYLLAIHPDIQERLRKEVDECFDAHGEHPSLDVVTKLNYLHCVVSEALRMYPPGSRGLQSTTTSLGDTGIKLKKGDVVGVPVYAMHHDPQYFPDPFTFNPERFSDENVGSIQPYTYLPFGAGPRNCIGMRFALQAVKLCVLHTIRNVQLVLTEKTKVSYVASLLSIRLRNEGIEDCGH
ncbi:hypothetical protein HPB48_012625 [Haemaphysalis longicornis]|uniref:Cytochrome n=1 Tax=Haemaphysalis longicornis TaxID=44386 RepID=A0A9J6FZC6_HAELO|nr:hypothetical protein HPB48_012625 [Haemaphysalis longicornis]